ncbi:hypothetical protein Pelo_618 [Pelomyxa schiedti]|nr:hypothetical protein Pelo_618 [Pelomyxa schiedti]
MFTIPITSEDIRYAGTYENISKAKLQFSNCGLSSEDIVKGLQLAPSILSGKVIKCFIHHFHLSGHQVRYIGEELLNSLMASGKTKCAEWFIREYRVPMGVTLSTSLRHFSQPLHIRVTKQRLGITAAAIET